MVSDGKIRRMDEKVDEFRMRIKDSSQRAVFSDVFDDATLMALYGLAKKGYIDAMGGSVSTGKEANVFHAISKEYGEIAVKIFMMSTANFNAMKEYILGDPRFMGIKHAKKDIILAWAKKEFKNLKRAKEAGVRVPEPYVVKRNILLMEFMGNDGVAMPQLKDVILSQDDAERIFKKILEYMNLLYWKAELVHADLSEYNILVDLNDMSPVIIDMGQSVTTEHFNAETFLIRDVNNIARYFNKLNLRINEEEMMTMIKEREK
ncbi:MAG: serine protein kinase RIO [Euryarchaeota archaeon]|nr:serine protein kinase RIO [Euryarchaeota archaeon]MBU4138690.1 serine protein kinase RIO [Euryarchaeota archaeon]